MIIVFFFFCCVSFYLQFIIITVANGIMVYLYLVVAKNGMQIVVLLEWVLGELSVFVAMIQ